MNLIIGDRRNLALEFAPVEGSYTQNDGRLFLYIDRVKIGDEEDTYDYFSSVSNVVDSYKKKPQQYPELFDLHSCELLPAIVRVMEWDEDFPDMAISTMKKKSRDLIENSREIL